MGVMYGFDGEYSNAFPAGQLCTNDHSIRCLLLCWADDRAPSADQE
jgi:hypothetical protein